MCEQNHTVVCTWLIIATYDDHCSIRSAAWIKEGQPTDNAGAMTLIVLDLRRADQEVVLQAAMRLYQARISRRAALSLPALRHELVRAV